MAHLDKPCMIILSGPGASGKTTVAMRLWETLPGQPAYICLDNLKDFQRPPNATDAHLDLASMNARSVAGNFLEAGHNVVLAKAFGRYEFVAPFVELGESFGVRVVYVKLTAPLELLIERNRRRREYSERELAAQMRYRRYTASDDRIRELYQFCLAHRHPQGVEYDTSLLSEDEVAAIVMQTVGAR